MKKFLVLLYLLIMFGCASVPVRQPEFEGVFKVDGTNPDGTEYVYHAVATTVAPGMTAVTYLDGQGQRVAECGVIREDNVLAFSCQPRSVALLRVENDRKVTGQWWAPGEIMVGREVWTKVDELPVVATPAEPQIIHPTPDAPGTIKL